MANIINNNFNNLKLKLNNDEYWDFFVCKDAFRTYGIAEDMDENGCLVSYINASDEECVTEADQWIKSKKDYVWSSANTTDYTLNNIGYTGFDNGLFSFRKDRILNSDFVKLYRETIFHNDDDTMVLRLHQVSGSTLQYEYPLHVTSGAIRCNGGFYQGYFETTCDEYAVLPSQIEDEWNLEFTLKKSNLEPESTKTLNDKYPNNKGFFFYIGTRAENKWIYLYDDSEDECDNLGMGEYVDGGEIDMKTYGLTNFLDVTFDDLPTPYEAVFLDDYLTFKYYGENLYYPTDLDKDKFFIDDYVRLTDKPNLIDEEHNDFDRIRWCCQYQAEVDKISVCRCGCGCKAYTLPYQGEENESLIGYYSKCNLFGDDYLEEDEDIDYITDWVEPDIDISNFEYETYDGFNLKYSKQYTIRTDNKFLFFDRTCTGFTVHNWIDGEYVEFQGRKTAFKGNLFLYMNRTCTGWDVNSIECYRNTLSEDYDIYKDLYNNALGFRITDSGAIGYRYIALDCSADTKCAVVEAYSKDGVIQDDKWYNIHIKINALNAYKMKMYFYVNGRLKFITKELPLLNLRALDDLQEKQEGVGYNISLGGGTQGLAETILPNYMRNPYRTYPLEKNFAGSFIGYIKVFKFYQCPMNYSQINYQISKLKY